MVVLDLRVELETSNEYKGGQLEMHQPPEKQRFIGNCSKKPLGKKKKQKEMEVKIKGPELKLSIV